GGVASGRRRALTDAAVRDQREAARNLRPHAGQVEARADDLGVFELVDLGRAGLAPGGLERTRRAEVTRVADLVAERVEADGAVAREELRVQLRVLVAEDDVVEGDERARSGRLRNRDLVL